MDEVRYHELLHAMKRFLIYRPRSAFEVKQKLLQKKICAEPEALRFIRELEAQGLVNDARFAENRANFRLENGYGRYYIERELKLAGVPAEVVARSMPKEQEFVQAARRYLQKRRARDPLVRLRGRGFSEDVIKKIKALTAMEKSKLSD